MIIKTVLFALFVGMTWASAPSIIGVGLEIPPMDPPIPSVNLFSNRDNGLEMVWNGDRFVWQKNA